MKVIIAEKPSVAKNIADAVGAKGRRDGFYEGADYLVTWAFGHLLELLDAKEYDEKMASWRLDNYPFIPSVFQYRVKCDPHDRKVVDSGAKKQIEIIEGLINRENVVGIISATDYDREGQIIGDIILEFLKTEKPIERLLLNEWTAEEVKSGLEKLVSNKQMEPLRDAGISRQWADWTIGINLTSVATLKYQRGSGRALNIGRVLLPTLKIIYDRDMEIEKFVSEEFHKLTTTFKSPDGIAYEGIYQLGDGEKTVDRFTDKKPLDALVASMVGQSGRVIDKQVEQKREYPPALFNLSNLQGYVTSKEKGWTSEKVLKVAQSLYEKKFITYPRTASLALEESLTQKAERVLNAVKKGLPYEKEVQFHTSKRVFDNAKVESHSAIMPTYMIPNGLSPDEKVVYEAVRNRFIMQFMPIAEHEEATLTTSVDVQETLGGVFVTRGRIQKIVGWKKVEKIQSKDKELPPVEVNTIVSIGKSSIETKGTSPPKRHTEKTLLKVMETCGKKFKNSSKRIEIEVESDSDSETDHEIESDMDYSQEKVDDEMLTAILSGFAIGTPATRAETISKLKSIGYIAVKGKTLYATDVGRNLVEKFPIKELFDLEYTGRLEKTLSDIGKGTISKGEFLERIFEFTRQAVESIKKDDFHVISVLENHKNGASHSDDSRDSNANVGSHLREILGKCPGCGSDVVEGEKGFGCTNWKGGCKFVVWKNDKFLASLKVRPTKQTVIKLLETGSVSSGGFISKKGTRFSARLTYEKNQETGFYSWKMNFD